MKPMKRKVILPPCFIVIEEAFKSIAHPDFKERRHFVTPIFHLDTNEGVS